MNCIICGSETELIKDNKFEDVYFKCEKCEVIFLQRDHILKKSDEKKEYSRHNNSLENNGYVNSFRELIDRYIIDIAGNIKEKRILDFGCGPNPVLAKILKRYDADVDHYDPIFFDKQLEKTFYDIVLSTEVFEHLKDPYTELEVIKDILKPNGFLFIKTQFHNNIVNDFLKWWYRRDPTHIIFYTPETFKYMAKNAGYDIIYTDNEEVIVLKKGKS